MNKKDSVKDNKKWIMTRKETMKKRDEMQHREEMFL